ncbi:MAG: ADP-ribosylation factor-like protein [Candidatus Hodarchaeales archaeon]
MSNKSRIFCVRIIDLESGLILINRKYHTESQEEYSENVLSTIVSFAREKVNAQENVETIVMKDRKVVMETTQNLVFIIVVSSDYDSQDAKRILSHTRATFLRRYPLCSCNWVFDGDVAHFKDFEPFLDEIVRHFGDKKRVIKIVLMGLDYAGKTTLTHAFAGTDYKSYLPTTGLDILRIEYRSVHIRIWDLGGQTQFRKLWPKFASEASGIIFVIDSTTDRWIETKQVFEVALLFHIPVIIFANKQDQVEKAVSVDVIAERLKYPQSKIVKGSALLNDGVFDVLDRLLDEIIAL